MQKTFQPKKFKWKLLFLVLFITIIIYLLANNNKISGESPSNFSNSETTFSNAPPAATSGVKTVPEQDESTLRKPNTTKKSEPTKSEAVNLDSKTIEKLRSNAKFALSTIYSAQAAFYVEHNRYSTDFKSLGIEPPEAIMNFKMGFLNELNDDSITLNAEEDSTRKNSDIFIGEPFSGSSQRMEYSPEAQDIDLNQYQNLCERNCSADAQHFEMLLVLPLGKGQKPDVWLINEKKILRQVQDGTKVN